MIELTVPIGHHPRRGDVLVTVNDSGAIDLKYSRPALDCRLSFDEAEHLAAALRDVARIVRYRHGLGMTEVA